MTKSELRIKQLPVLVRFAQDDGLTGDDVIAGVLLSLMVKTLTGLLRTTTKPCRVGARQK